MVLYISKSYRIYLASSPFMYIRYTYSVCWTCTIRSNSMDQIYYLATAIFEGQPNKSKVVGGGEMARSL